MALTSVRALEVATEAKGIADDLAALHERVRTFLAQNSHLSIDWGAAQKPAYINEDASGNIDGLLFSRAQLSNAIGSFQEFSDLMNNAAVTQGDHLGNINQLADAG